MQGCVEQMVEKIDAILYELEHSEELKKDEGFLVPTKNIWVVDALRDSNRALEEENEELKKQLEAEKQRAEAEKQRAEAEKQRAVELEQKLKELLKKQK